MADKPQVMAFFAFLQGMIHQKVQQVIFLLRREDSRAAAKGAGTVKG